MNHVALDGAWPHNGDLDHQVVETGRAQAWQHGHLCARFDLKYAHGVGTGNHGIYRRVFGGDPVHGELPVVMAID